MPSAKHALRFTSLRNGVGALLQDCVNDESSDSVAFRNSVAWWGCTVKNTHMNGARHDSDVENGRGLRASHAYEVATLGNERSRENSRSGQRQAYKLL